MQNKKIWYPLDLRISKRRNKMEKQNEMKKSTVIIILVAIILIQAIARIYVGYKKEYFHIDEAYSYSLMNYDKIQITENDDFYGNWHSKEYYLDYLSINEDEKWDWTPVYENQKNDVHPPLYYLLLRTAAMFTIGNFTKWTGIILNIIIWIFSAILVYFIAKELFKNQKMALFTCLIVGLTLGALETTAYIRMYELANLFILLITYLHIKLYEKQEIKVKDLITIGISILLGSLTHYYVIVYTAIIFIIFVIKYISKKQYKNLIKYVACFGIAAVLSILIFPYSLEHMFGGYRGDEAKTNLLSQDKLFDNLEQYLNIITKNLFGKLAIAFIAIYIILYIKKRKETIAEDKKINLLLIPEILYFILIAQISSYKELRYIMPIMSIAMITVIYMSYCLAKKYINEKKAQIVIIIIFTIIIISPLFSNIQLEFTYTKMNNLAQKVQEKSEIPALYIFNENNIRFLDDIYIFTILDESYIMKYNETTIENIQKVMKDKDISKGLIVVCNDGVDTDEVIKQIKETYNYQSEEEMQRLNCGTIKYLK